MSEESISKVRAEAVHTRAAKGGVISGVSFVMNLGLNLIQVPLLLRFWLQETYGLWLSVSALAALLTTLDGGHQLYVGNLLNRSYVEDRDVFRRTMASAVQIASLTSAVQIALTLVLCFSGLASRWLDIAQQHSAEFALSVVIYTVGWISTGSVGAILVRVFIPTGYFVRSTLWALIARLAQFGAVAFAACHGYSLVGTTLLFSGVVFTYNIAIYIDIRRLYPGLFPWWRGGDIKLGFRNFSRSSVVSVVSILDLFSLQGVILLVTGTLGAAVVPLFTTLRTVSNTALQGTGFLLNPIQPDLVRYHVQREGGKIGAVFAFFWCVTGAVINGGMVAGLFFVEPLYHFWTRGKLEFDRTLFAWLAAAVLIRTLAAPVQNYLSAINHLRALFITSVVRATLTVAGVVVLAPIWKLSGVGAALFAAEVVGSFLLPWLFVHTVLAGIGNGLGMAVPGKAVISTIFSCVALVGFVVNVWFWPWLVVVILVALAVIAVVQWRSLLPDVQARALSVTRPLFGIRRVSALAK